MEGGYQDEAAEFSEEDVEAIVRGAINTIFINNSHFIK